MGLLLQTCTNHGFTKMPFGSVLDALNGDCLLAWLACLAVVCCILDLLVLDLAYGLLGCLLSWSAAAFLTCYPWSGLPLLGICSGWRPFHRLLCKLCPEPEWVSAAAETLALAVPGSGLLRNCLRWAFIDAGGLRRGRDGSDRTPCL